MPKRSDTKPWEQQQGESAKAFEAFKVYLDMGSDRSIRAVGEKLSKSSTLMARWSSTHGWVERVAAYDADLRRQAHDQAVKSARKMSERHIKLALQLQETAIKALSKMKPEDLDPKNLIAFVREATKLERENRTDIVQATDPNKGEAAGQSSLADVITQAWERRQNQDEPDD